MPLMSRLRMEVLVAGGGIAGLAMARTCHEIGLPVRVYESAPSLGACGLSVNLQPNAVRELYGAVVDRLGPDIVRTTNCHTGTMTVHFPALDRQRTARRSSQHGRSRPEEIRCRSSSGHGGASSVAAY
jgi:2-polyprenyl-6-methoxyphenol hydroxylase-like FAD-dependent oxidoreductase